MINIMFCEWNGTRPFRTCRDPFDTKKISNLSPKILVEWIAPSPQRFSRPQSTASHLFARTRSFHRPTYKRPDPIRSDAVQILLTLGPLFMSMYMTHPSPLTPSPHPSPLTPKLGLLEIFVTGCTTSYRNVRCQIC